LTGAKLVASGAYELGNTGTATVTNFGFGGAITSEQDIAISANDASGDAHALTVKLATGTSTANLDMVIGDINNALQTSNDSTLQQITAVQTNTNGIPGINFVRTLKSFSVSVGATTASTSGAMLGIVDGVGGQGTVTSSVQNGTGGTADISTMSGAQEAVTAITNAVTLLGTAQAEVGKGENQLNFAIALAQSQITNFSAAESNIRDANVAQEAANLTKAQTLQQASIAAMAQANSAPQAVLTLLRG
jgi:flagellin